MSAFRSESGGPPMNAVESRDLLLARMILGALREYGALKRSVTVEVNEEGVVILHVEVVKDGSVEIVIPN